MKLFQKFGLHFVVLLGLVAAVLAGYHSIQAQSTKPTPEKYDSKKDQLVTPTQKTIKDEITLAGSISSSDVANVQFQTSGKLAWVGVKVGDRVKKGQAIASLDKTDLQKNLQKTFNDYQTQATQFYDTSDQYKNTDTITDQIRRIKERSQHTLDNSVIAYELADLAVKYATITSPVDGVVTAISQPFAGVNVTPASAIFTIINPNSVYMKAEIDQSQVTKAQLGQAATLTLDSFPGKTLDSKVSYISFNPVAGESSTVYEVRFALPIDNQNLTYRLGMEGDATIFVRQSENALTVPLDATYEDDNGNTYVLVKTDNILTRRPVKTGIENDTDVEILDGLSGHETLVIKKS